MDRNEAIVFVTNYDDWEALYIHGRLVLEGHRLQRRDFVRLIQGCPGDIANYTLSTDYTNTCGDLPKLFRDIPAEAILEREAY